MEDFNWEAYKRGELLVHCATERSFEDFTTETNIHGCVCREPFYDTFCYGIYGMVSMGFSENGCLPVVQWCETTEVEPAEQPDRQILENPVESMLLDDLVARMHRYINGKEKSPKALKAILWDMDTLINMPAPIKE